MSSNENYSDLKRVTFSKALFFRLLSKMKYGKITIIESNHSTEFKGDSIQDCPEATITIHDRAVFKALLFEGSIGAGRSVTLP